MAEVLELLEAGEAKALYGLSINWKPLQALVEALQDRGVLQGKEVSGDIFLFLCCVAGVGSHSLLRNTFSRPLTSN